MDTLLNILVVEDHDALREATVEALCGLGHHAIGVDCAEGVVEMAKSAHVDLLLVDLNLPGEDGLSLARRMRQSQPDIGIIMLTGRTKAQALAQGYSSGADIYLTKPIAMEDLNAAISALARRLKPPATPTSALSLDMNKLTLRGEIAEISLSAPEASVLAAFARAPGQRLEHWQIIAVLGKHDYSKAGLEMLIARLRKKLTAVGIDELPIKAIRQFGYQLAIEIRLA